ncbi:alkaline phosphatase family protein [Nocardia sp. CDC153]|uniref:alkaline phosphatase family protein n=1 Tax=Nocardia sp. CDC153 TaxID=3112167 RepID=UPI002DBC74B5|nr:alkaline phosphatase family protein [Nocardia sp. CDC153]MEC3952359.1 alkaline phosphatase family protein [Nocardia sp. CDC153]
MRHNGGGNTRGKTLALAAAASLVWLGGAALTPTAAQAGVTSPNLIVDGDAEAVAQCSPRGLDGMTLPGWNIGKGEPNAVCYGQSGWPDASSPGPSNRGAKFFAGGGTGNSEMDQTVNVAAAGSAIDQGNVSFDLNGWLGGFGAQLDRVNMTATFLSASGAQLGSAECDDVSSIDRGLKTGMVQRDTKGTLPKGTRSVKIALNFTWTAGDTNDGYADDLSFTIGASLPAPKLTAPAASVPGYDHVFVVYMENQDYDGVSGIIGNSQAPYINGLRPQGATLSQSYATTHPSDPNYVALAAGGLYGLVDNSVGTTTIDATHIGNRVDAAHKTWKGYAEDENGNCDQTAHGQYYQDDLPFLYFKNIKSDAAYCAAHVQPLTQMTTDLKSAATTPNFVWFAANECHNMEGCGVASGDSWLSTTLPVIFDSPVWKQQRSLLILTFDEGAVKAFGPLYPNRVPTIMLGSQGSVKAGFTSSQRTDQYGLLRTIDTALGLQPLTNNDAYAATVNDIWSNPKQ